LREISLSAEKGLYKEMLAYALPMMLVGFAGMINETIDRILLIKLIPTTNIMHVVYNIKKVSNNYSIFYLSYIIFFFY
jgi:O-antigen/teichoic acid export membrane protein